MTDTVMYTQYIAILAPKQPWDGNVFGPFIGSSPGNLIAIKSFHWGPKTDQFADVSQGETIYGNLSLYYVPCIFREVEK